MKRLAALLLPALALLPAPSALGAEQAGAATPATSSALDPERVARAQKLVQIILPAEQRDAMFESALDAMMSNMIGGVLQGQEGFSELLAETPELQIAFGNFLERQRGLSLSRTSVKRCQS